MLKDLGRKKKQKFKNKKIKCKCGNIMSLQDAFDTDNIVFEDGGEHVYCDTCGKRIKIK